MAEKVTVLGLGVMGLGMAQNLRKAGFDVTVWNRTAAKAEAFAKEGGIAAGSPAEAAKGAKVVISMLADDTACRAAWLGEDGALAGMDKGAIAVESSTASPAWIEELHTAAHTFGVRLLDAPVTGSRVQAEGGQLVFLTGGDAATIEEARPVLAAMSKQVLPLGPVGSGAQLKLINNFLCGVQVASFAEALTWIERNGLDRTTALEFLKTAAPGSGIFVGMSERMTKRTYEVNFALDLMRKDLSYAQTAAEAYGVPLATAATAEHLFERAQQEGFGEKDMSSVVEVLRAAKS
ncbi:beta-hydroxyacid dehydrogenase, 3-hydroxyisobutyrate dehydrogenase [Terriglobus roseus DSM 18391]|uniref:Beta-hydroxyacid dehydrogenase, 3-hydroxyisobutyrate dehydrogenase n=1 Tax=Terriglobus roseus (strain DSM 18391 / NRRL B-41598 / KBS 63) TaxID=926566 RepID=I3ZDU9_TERRK|nr:NAD(P)-dependent oxidoreductase [Terriglobus roseus]AFL87417.1 beta-hydroxyacid dehydrogenase, 3-hydroxyisobutyrate dehydrogenase [Terriglobus roseus DSM 18391]